MEKQAIGSVIALLRKQRGMTQLDLAVRWESLLRFFHLWVGLVGGEHGSGMPGIGLACLALCMPYRGK